MKRVSKIELAWCEVSILFYKSLERGCPETFTWFYSSSKLVFIQEIKYTCSATFHVLLMPWFLIVLPFGTVESVQMRKKSSHSRNIIEVHCTAVYEFVLSQLLACFIGNSTMKQLQQNMWDSHGDKCVRYCVLRVGYQGFGPLLSFRDVGTQLLE